MCFYDKKRSLKVIITNHLLSPNTYAGTLAMMLLIRTILLVISLLMVTFDGKLESLESYRIGVVADYSYGEKFDSFNFPHKKITRDDKHLIKMLCTIVLMWESEADLS